MKTKPKMIADPNFLIDIDFDLDTLLYDPWWDQGEEFDLDFEGIENGTLV